LQTVPYSFSFVTLFLLPVIVENALFALQSSQYLVVFIVNLLVLAGKEVVGVASLIVLKLILLQYTLRIPLFFKIHPGLPRPLLIRWQHARVGLKVSDL